MDVKEQGAPVEQTLNEESQLRPFNVANMNDFSVDKAKHSDIWNNYREATDDDGRVTASPCHGAVDESRSDFEIMEEEDSTPKMSKVIANIPTGPAQWEMWPTFGS